MKTTSPFRVWLSHVEGLTDGKVTKGGNVVFTAQPSVGVVIPEMGSEARRRGMGDGLRQRQPLHPVQRAGGYKRPHCGQRRRLQPLHADLWRGGRY